MTLRALNCLLLLIALRASKQRRFWSPRRPKP